jgi:hypothetical protein
MLKAAIFGAAMALAAIPAQAVVLVLDGGWQSDTIGLAGVASANSPFTFRVMSSAVLRVTDAFLPGDTYTVADADSIIGTTGFASDGAVVPSFFGVDWSDVSYGRLGLLLDPGSYAFSISGGCENGCPATFGVRLDSVETAPPPPGPGVPEPTAWAMLVIGFGVVGATLRRRSTGAQVVAS